MKVFEHRSQIRKPERVFSWTFKIAKNVYLMRQRRSEFAPCREHSLDHLISVSEGSPRLVVHLADTSRTPDANVISAQAMQLLHSAVRELPPPYAAVVQLRDFEELSTQEVADRLRVSPDVVKTRLCRAHRMLRMKLP